MDAKVARSALDLFNTDKIDILFTDIQLGGALNGWDVAEAMRAQEPGRAVTYASGNSGDDKASVARSVLREGLRFRGVACRLLTGSTRRPSRRII